MLIVKNRKANLKYFSNFFFWSNSCWLLILIISLYSSFSILNQYWINNKMIKPMTLVHYYYFFKCNTFYDMKYIHVVNCNWITILDRYDDNDKNPKKIVMYSTRGFARFSFDFQCRLLQTNIKFDENYYFSLYLKMTVVFHWAISDSSIENRSAQH